MKHRDIDRQRAFRVREPGSIISGPTQALNHKLVRMKLAHENAPSKSLGIMSFAELQQQANVIRIHEKHLLQADGDRLTLSQASHRSLLILLLVISIFNPIWSDSHR